MRNFQVVIFCVVFCSMAKLNEAQYWRRNFFSAPEQDEEDLKILENSGSNLRNDNDVRDRPYPYSQNRPVLFDDDEEFNGAGISPRSRRQRSQPGDFRDGTIIRMLRSLNIDSQDYSRCGLDSESSTNGSRADLGDNNSTRTWPWLAALYYKEGHLPSKTIRCGGSIINENFVLTAATCAIRSNNLIRKSNEVTVKLGLTNSKGVDQTQEIGVRAIHVHPQFSYDNYDYDVALLELERPIEYNLYIRPVCLPSTETSSNFYKPGSLALAIGWGHDGMQPQTNSAKHTVKEIDLIIQHPNNCKKSLRQRKLEARFTDRMFCAAEVKRYSCVGDGGGPAMQSGLSKDGHLTWTQVGIVSWGVGCGVKDEYAFYSHVYELMPWISTTANRSKP